MNIDIEYKDVEFNVEFDYQPYEAPETGIEAQYAGCLEMVYVLEIYHKGICFLDFFDNHDYDVIETLILNKIKNDKLEY